MKNNELLKRWIGGSSLGVEIGAFKTPLPIIRPYYVDRFEEYAGEKCLLDFKGDACSLPFWDCSLDYVATSHVIEHVANPFQAFKEWARVLVDRGVIYLVVPDKSKTWDRLRPTTKAQHLLDDFMKKVDQTDGTHVSDFADGIIWSEFAPGKGEDERLIYRKALEEAVKAKAEINIHFHTFEAASFPKIIEEFNNAKVIDGFLDLVELVEDFPDDNPIGFGAVLVLRSGLKKKIQSLWGLPKRRLSRSSAIKRDENAISR
jgi:ubiquinone/menaquinone biosynthesis C-methylase UbiE